MQIAVSYISESYRAKAFQLAKALNLFLLEPVTEGQQNYQDYSLVLFVTEKGLQLKQTAKRANPLYVDFLSPKMLYRLKHGGGRRQLLAKAIGIKKGYLPTVLDATAGFGKDAFVLAALGCKVHMLERSPIVGALLHDGLNRLKEALDKKQYKFLPKDFYLSLTITQAVDYINHIDNAGLPDVIYLDPMFPQNKQGKTALNKQEMRILKLVADNGISKDEKSDEENLFFSALRVAQKRVIVKRPRYALPIANQNPQIIFKGKSCRYDVYATITAASCDELPRLETRD